MNKILCDKYKPHKVDDLLIEDNLKQKLIQTNDNILLVSSSYGTGKCFSKNTKVLTINGFKNIQSIKEGDLILTDNNTFERVISTTSGIDTLYKIEQKSYFNSDFETYKVNSAHIISLYNVFTEEKIDINIVDYLNNQQDKYKNYYGYTKSLDLDCNFSIFKPKEIYIQELNYYLNNFCIKKVNYSTKQHFIIQNDKISYVKFLCKSIGIYYFTTDKYKLQNITENNVIIIELNEVFENIDKIKKSEYDYFCYDLIITPDEKDEYYGFTLENNNRFYLSDMTIVHNSSTIKCLVNELIDKKDDNILEINLLEIKNIEIIEKVVFFCKKVTQKKKIIIIDDIDLINEKYQNLLSEIIEKYQNVKFILATNFIEKIVLPIQNRCFLFNFKKTKFIEQKLNEIIKLELELKQEQKQKQELDIQDIMIIADGDLKKAINLLEVKLYGDGEIYEICNFPSSDKLNKLFFFKTKKEYMKYTLDLIEKYNYNNIILSLIQILNKKNDIKLLEIVHDSYLIINKQTNSKIQMLDMFNKFYQALVGI